MMGIDAFNILEISLPRRMFFSGITRIDFLGIFVTYTQRQV